MRTFLCSAILFDLDGVLVDSTPSVARQWRLWSQENGVDPEKVLKIAHGRRTVEVVRLLAPHLQAEEEVQKLEQREAADTEGVTVMPGAGDLVRSVPDGRWGVVTSGTRHLATSRLRLGNLPIPRVLVSADEVVKGKPDPEPFLKGAGLLGVHAEECLVIEDAPAGIQSARAGGMKVIGITSTYPASQLSVADAVVEELSQIHVGQDGARRLAVSIDLRPVSLNTDIVF
jgi:mannitol-1-/sugar-/sorbitol-6-phosphatase